MKRVESSGSIEKVEATPPSTPLRLARTRSFTVSVTAFPSTSEASPTIQDASIVDPRSRSLNLKRHGIDQLRQEAVELPMSPRLHSIRSFMGELARETPTTAMLKVEDPLAASLPDRRRSRSIYAFAEDSLSLSASNILNPALPGTLGSVQPQDVFAPDLIANEAGMLNAGAPMEIKFEIYTAQALEKMHSAILHLDSTKSDTEIYLLQESCTDQCDAIMEKLVERLKSVSDPVAVHEEILQAKVLLFNAWMEVIQKEVASSYPETSQALVDVEAAHKALFHDYPGFIESLSDDSTTDQPPRVRTSSHDPPSSSPRTAATLDTVSDSVFRSNVSYTYTNDAKSKESRSRGGRDAQKPPVRLTRTPTTIDMPKKPFLAPRWTRVKIFLLGYLRSLLPLLYWLPLYPTMTDPPKRLPSLPHHNDLSTPDNGTDNNKRNTLLWGILSTFKFDLVAGLTIGIVMVAQGMAYAMLSHIPPEAGLYCGFVPVMIYSLFGTSRQGSMGPVALVSLLTGLAVNSLNYNNPALIMGAASALAFMVGLIMLVLGLLRLGFIVNFLSQPLLKGFMQAAAVVIFSSQLQALFGTSPLADTPYAWMTVYSFFEQIGTVKYLNVIFGVGFLILILFSRWFQPKIPFSLIAVFLGILFAWACRLDRYGLVIVGSIVPGLPQPSIPDFPALASLIPNAFVIFVVGFMEHITLTKNYAKQHGYEVDANQELIALGLANIMGSFFGAYPTFCAFARSAISDVTGARSQVANFVSSIVMTVVLVSLTWLFYFLPKAVLGATVCAAVTTLFDFKILPVLWKTSKFDLLCLVATFVLTLGFGVDIGILIAIGFSFVLVVYQVSRPTIAILGRWPGTVIYRDIERTDVKAITTPGVSIFRFESRIFFANVQFLRQQLSEIMEALMLDIPQTPNRALIFDMSAVPTIDSTGVATIRDIVIEYSKRNILFCVTNLEGPALVTFHDADLVSLIGEEKFFYRVHDAVRAVSVGNLMVSVPPETTMTKNGYQLISERCISMRSSSSDVTADEERQSLLRV